MDVGQKPRKHAHEQHHCPWGKKTHSLPSIRMSSLPFSDCKVIIKAHHRKQQPKLNSYSESFVSSVHSKIDYSSYRPFDMCKTPAMNSDELFHGIIHYIYVKSFCQYNKNEMLLEYRSLAPNSDPANILDIHSPQVFQFDIGPHQFLMVTFHHIFVRPTAYVIRAGPNNASSPQLIAFIFQGFDRDKQEWVTLDERHNIFEIVPAYIARICFIDTDRFCSQFRILQTYPSNRKSMQFSMSGLEIHGAIKISITSPSSFDVDLNGEEGEAVSDVEFDPWAIPEIGS
jgi:hypothetical protein